jgi:hypothetical protein
MRLSRHRGGQKSFESHPQLTYYEAEVSNNGSTLMLIIDYKGGDITFVYATVAITRWRKHRVFQ